LINIKVKDLDGRVHEIEGRQGDSLMEVLREHAWGVPAICGGLLSCGTCHVYLDDDWLDKFQQKDPEEQDLLNDFGCSEDNSRLSCQEDNSRLSCQLPLQAVHDGLSLSIAPDE